MKEMVLNGHDQITSNVSAADIWQNKPTRNLMCSFISRRKLWMCQWTANILRNGIWNYLTLKD